MGRADDIPGPVPQPGHVAMGHAAGRQRVSGHHAQLHDRVQARLMIGHYYARAGRAEVLEAAAGHPRPRSTQPDPGPPPHNPVGEAGVGAGRAAAPHQHGTGRRGQHPRSERRHRPPGRPAALGLRLRPRGRGAAGEQGRGQADCAGDQGERGSTPRIATMRGAAPLPALTCCSWKRGAGRSGTRSARPGRSRRPSAARSRCRSSAAAAGNQTWSGPRRSPDR